MTRVNHPAKFHPSILEAIAELLVDRIEPGFRVLDPFAGSGKVFELEKMLPGVCIEAIELEPEFAALHPRTRVGNALDLPFDNASFDAIVTSPPYGNRLADRLLLDGTRRFTYANALGRDLSPGNTGALQWGEKYRRGHERAWREAKRVLRPSGYVVLNCKNHVRGGVVVPVTGWHVHCLASLGFQVIDSRDVKTPSLRQGRNHNIRVDHESVILLQLAN